MAVLTTPQPRVLDERGFSWMYLGVRLALGSRRGGVVWLVLREVAGVVLAGVAVGGLGAALAGGLLTATALVAGLLPALRASRLDPAAI